jgi:hypothetical protein
MIIDGWAWDGVGLPWQAVIYLAVFPDPSQISTVAWSQTPFILLIVVAGVALRHRALAAARRLVADDRAAYDALWSRITAAPGAVVALENLNLAAMRLNLASSYMEARTTCWRRPGSPGPQQLDLHQLRPSDVTALHWWELAGSRIDPSHVRDLGPGGPTRCLDQLYAQAVAAGPLLLGRVRMWALLSAGGFPLRRPTRDNVWIRWREAREDPELLNQIGWGQCKSASRAIEKIVRSYNQVQLLPACI